MNQLKTLFLLTVLTLILVYAGRLIGGNGGMAMALVLAVVMNVGAYWFSDKIALRMAGARPATEAEAPALFRMVADLAREANIPLPRVYVIEQPAPNAFATGRDPQHAVVAVTAGILDLVSERELRAVLAHELGHVQNRDTLVMAVVASLAGAISYLAQMAQWSMIFGGRGDDDERGNMLGMLVGIIVLPIAALLVQLAISRSREYGADDSGAELSRDPLALASALRKMSTYSKRVPLPVNPSVSSLFIVQPLIPGAMSGLFSTHPPIEARIARLEQRAGAVLG
ncbi:MAG: zinc metalloprotease HtpX [Chloroflexi bacterium]|nr:zinc metalloprotease HtpX [Chloroflexota bacterium]